MKKIICWWSGGITSAVACKITIDTYGLENCRLVFIDTKNEDEDTYRFKKDCEKWYGANIETITRVGKNKTYGSIQDVWHDFTSLNVAHGAICSSELKRTVRLDFQRQNEYSFQVFGFDVSEVKRATNIKTNYPKTNPIFPLLLFGYTKKECLKIVGRSGIEVPRMYKLGFHNNNCFKTGCVQGGIGYWQKMQRDFPEKFNRMADLEHELTNEKGKPVVILKDQSKSAKKSGLFQVFLKPHPDYPFHKDISMMSGKEVETLMECNGFCSTENA